MCHRTTNYLICLLPLLLPFSIPLLHYLPSSPHAEFPHFLSPPLRQPRYLSLSPPLSLSLPCWPPPFLNLTLSFLVPSALSGWEFSLGSVTFKKLLIKFCCSSHYRRQRGREVRRGGGWRGGRWGQTGVGWDGEWEEEMAGERKVRNKGTAREKPAEGGRWESVQQTLCESDGGASRLSSNESDASSQIHIPSSRSSAFILKPSFFSLPPSIFVVNFILLIKLRKQSWFTVNLIKAACLRRIPLCTAKSNLLSIRFTQRSIHLHWRLLGTICGYLGLRERGERWQGRWGEQSEERGGRR